MLTIALKMLLDNKLRAISTIAGIAMAFFLSAAQVGLLVGWCNTTSAIIWNSTADVWVMAERNQAFDYGTAIPRQRLYQVRSAPGVEWAEPMFMGWTFWKDPSGQQHNIELIGIDDNLVGGPWRMTEGDARVITDPDAVIIDALYLEKLGIRQVGDEAEILGRRAIVRAISRDVRTITAAPFVFTSFEAAVRYDHRYESDHVTYVMARARPGISAEQLRDSIAAEVPAVQVLTTKEFAHKTMSYWMLGTGLGITVVLTALLGLVVGAVLISQTLYAITNDHLPNYATLLALGFGRQRLVAIVVLQAVFFGVAGIVLGSLLFGQVAASSQTTPIPLETTPLVFSAVVTALMASCLGASVLSVYSIFRVDPVTVFRN